MADASGSGGLGALTLGGIAGTAVVLGGVVLFQLGILGSGEPEPGAADGSQGGSQTAANDGGFTGDGDESGQPLQNNGLSQSGEADADIAAAAEAPEQPEAAETASTEAQPEETGAAEVDPEAEEPAGTDSAAVAEEQTLTGGNETETAQDEAASVEAGEQIALAETAGETEAVAEPALQEPEAKEDIFVLEAPELDLVRVDSEGAAVIAGRAQEGVRISVLLDGEVLEQVEVPAGGEFVSLTNIPASAEARVVSLLAEHDGQKSTSGASFILAPVSPVAAVPEEQPAETAAAETAEPDAPAAAGAVQEDVAAGAEQPAAGEELAAVSEPADSPAADQSESTPAAVEESAASVETEAAEAVAPSQDAADAAGAEPAAQDPALAGEPAAPQPQGQAVAVLRADADGIEVVQPAIPADPELSDEVALDSISYNGTGGVELTGRARPKSRVRIYVDNAPVAELETGADGRWNGQLEGVEPGIYTLRLDEIELTSGAVVSRLETPFKREAPEALPKPNGDETPDQPAPLVRAVTVQKGDTLWAISQEKYGSGFLYVRVFEANRGAIRDPDLIYPGQVFAIPE